MQSVTGERRKEQAGCIVSDYIVCLVSDLLPFIKTVYYRFYNTFFTIYKNHTTVYINEVCCVGRVEIQIEI